MGLLQRLLGRASEPSESEHSSERSSGRAAQSGDDLVAELRALKAEIRALRESLANSAGGRRSAAEAPQTGSLSILPSPTSDAQDATEDRTRRRRGGRGRGRGDRSADGGPPRDRGERGDRPERGERYDRGDRPERDDRYERRERTSDFFEDDGEAIEAKRVRTPRPPPEDAPTGPLVDFLKERGILVYEGQDDLNRNEAFEHLARHLGTHFDLLAPFYEKTKRLVASGRGAKFEVEHFSDQERSAAVQFGTLLHRHGMLKDFYYHRSPKKALRVIPTKDGKTGQFLTGGWLEIFVSMLLSKRLRAHLSPAKYQMLYNVKGALPDGREFEADIMAVVEGRMFWLECKTGNWQDYSARFRGLVQTFGVDRNSSGLLLLRAPDVSTRSRATDMLDMTVMSLQEVDAFLCRFLGVEPGGEPLLAGMASEGGEAVDDLYATVDLESGAPRSGGRGGEEDEDEVETDADGAPLENVAPARKLGRVALPGMPAAEAGEDAEPAAAEGEGGVRRKRRRRRRRGGGGGAAAAGAGAGARLLEPLQIFGEDGASDRADESESHDEGIVHGERADALADESAVAADADDARGERSDRGDRGAGGAGGAPETEGEARPKRRRRGRRGGSKPSPFAAEGDGDTPGRADSAPTEDEESEAPAVARALAERTAEADEARAEPVAAPRPEPPRRRSEPMATPVPAPPPAPAPVKPPVPAAGPKIGATGATIAPDWRKMVAGAPKKTDGPAE
jgi:hypothetical protein